MFAIAPYVFYVQDGKKIKQDLTSLNKVKFNDYLRSYFKGIKGNQVKLPPLPGRPSKTFIFQDFYLGTLNSIGGLYKTGEYGFESEIYSFSSKKVEHHKAIDEADMKSFHFSFYMPISSVVSNRLQGVLLLSRFHTHGIRNIVAPNLISGFAQTFPGLELKIERLVPDKLVSTMLKSTNVKRIRLIKHALPKDLANVLSANDLQKFQDFECIIKPKRKTYFTDVDWAIQVIQNKTKPQSLTTFGDFTPDRVKLELVSGAVKRTIDLGNLGRMSSNIILENITPGVDGHITASDWLREADSLADDIFLSWDVGMPKWNSGV